jgi:hypothetical protein
VLTRLHKHGPQTLTELSERDRVSPQLATPSAPATMTTAARYSSAPPPKATNSPASPGHSATPGSTSGCGPSAPKTAR